ncbi:ATP-binding protein [Cohnella cellulosilytica]|uniref:histidine kinase n=1 Tax=Cohnella cellulosilytica TaxID=986710 RepID=A0ABW2FGP6_9BACL
MSNNPRRSLLYYWSIRYFIVLLVSIVIASSAIIFLIYWDAKTKQRHGLEQTVRDVVAEAAERDGKLPQGAELGRLLDRHARENGLWDRSFVFVFDREWSLSEQFPSYAPFEAEGLIERLPPAAAGSVEIAELQSDENRLPYLAAVSPIRNAAGTTGYVAYLVQKETVLKTTPLEHRVLRFSIVAVAFIIGWGVLFLLTRRLLKPIQEAADAAKQIVAGNYRVDIDNSHDEREIHELMVSFKEMAERLEHLESLRNQLFLGVTHELKTPIASISGLIQAVKDEVVSEEEAKEFLEMSLKETGRLQKMVEDLLDFNRFAANSVTVTHRPVDLLAELNETVVRWKQAQERTSVQPTVETAGEGETWEVLTDPVRLEQIMINLLNNARDAMEEGGSILIRLHAEPSQYRIEVQDTGEGIPAEEQREIFQSFYRGEKKRTRTYGLGIGLPFSRLIAGSLGGDLALSRSGPEGTLFTLTIPAIHPLPKD